VSPLLLRSSRRFLTGHPGQIVLSVVGVALGVAVVVSIDLAIQSSRVAFRVSTETIAGRSTHQVLGGPGGIPDGVLTKIRLDAGYRLAAPVVEGYVSAPSLPGRPLRVLGIDPFSELPFRPYLAGGRAGVDVSTLLTVQGTALLAAETAREASVAAGDTLRVQVSGRDRAALVAGLLDAEDELSRRGIQNLLVMDISQAQALLGQRGRLSRIDLRVPGGEPGDEILERIARVLPAGTRPVETGTRSETLQDMIGAFDLNLTALSLLALIFGMFLIYNTMTFSVVQRRTLIGSLRALGVTRREVLRLVMGEALGLGVVGTAVGLMVGVALGRGLVGLVTRTINDLYFVVSVEGLSLPPEAFLKGSLLGVVATLLAALPAAREATSAPARATLTRSVVEDRARRAVPRAAALGAGLQVLGGGLLALPSRSLPLSFAALFCIILGMALLAPLATVVLVRIAGPVMSRVAGIVGTMAARGVVTALSRTAPAIAALVVAVSVTVGLGVMISSFRQTLSLWLDATLQADVYVSPPELISNRAEGRLEPTLVERFARQPGVAGVSTYRGTVFEADYGVTRLVALDLYPRGEAAFDFKEGRREEAFRRFRSGEEVLVSEPFAYRHDLGVGSTVRLPSDGGEREFPVAGVFYDYGSDRGVIMMSRTTYDRHWSDPAVTSVGLFLEQGGQSEAVIAGVRRSAEGIQDVVVRSNRALREASLEVFERTFAITAVLRLLAFIVAFIGVLSALMALQLERARELGVLRANGMTPGQVWHLVASQTGLMGLAAGMLAVPAGVALAVVMIFVVNKRSFGWTLRLEVSPEILVQALALAVAGALLAGLVPAWRMSRTPPALALREE
jgi:putative ABC transport system permease protein